MLRGGQSEVLWLNEGLSHLAEELAGQQFRALGDNTNFTRFVLGNLLNAYNFLTDPGAVEVIVTDGSGTLPERGAAWLFLRWLTDTHGDDVPRRLAESSLRSTENVENAAGRPMGELLGEWFVANWVSDLLPDSIVPPRLHYATWMFRDTYRLLMEQAPEVFELPFPIVPDTLSVTTPFTVGGTLRSGSGDYYVVVQAPNDPALSFLFTDTSGGPLSSEGAPRLNVVRVR